VPVIEALARRVNAVISVDTSKPEVIVAALAAGAHMVNDVRALRAPGALAAAVTQDAAVCVMHMLGEPTTMQVNPHYDDVVTEVHQFLAGRVAACRAAGVHADSIVVDPGIGFGKTAQHNLALLRRLGAFADLGGPVLVGVSRKSIVGMMTGRSAVADRVIGSAALAALCVERGAKVLRVHDVAATVDAVRVAVAMMR
jgi:dihydropteroate synthase